MTNDRDVAAALLADFERRGIRHVVYRKRDGIDIVWRPYKKLTDEDRATLRAHWEAIRALVLEASASPSPDSGPRGFARTDEPERPQPPVSPSVSAFRPGREPEREPDRDALAAWRVEVRPGKQPRPIPPTNNDDFLELLRRSRKRDAFTNA